MTVRMKTGAIWTTLLVYLFILGGSLVTLALVIPRTLADFRARPDPSDFVSLLISVLAASVAAIVVNALIRFARLRIRADAQRVWVPRSFGRSEVLRTDLTVIRADRLSDPLARGVRVFRFVRRDGSEAFHIQAAIFPQAEIESLASYLGVPIDTNFP